MAMNRQRRTSNISNIFSYDDAGNIVIKDYSQVIRYSWNGTIHGFIGPVSVSSVAAAVTDTDKFLVSDGGVLKFRTGAEVLSDIGGQPVLTNPVTGTGVAGQVAYWSGTNSQTGSSNLFWDAANSRLGIGTNAPSTTLDIRGKARLQASGNCEFDFNDGSQFLRVGVNSTSGFLQTLTSIPLGFFTGATKRGEFSTNGNFILQNGGAFTDGGQRLQVQGNVYVNGTYVGTNTVETTGTFYSKGSGSGFRFSDGVSGIIDTGSSIQFRNYIVAPYQFTYQYGERTSGIRNIIEIPVNVNPTSGTAIYNMLVANPTINQTGGANGITRGLYVQPTLTAAADWRSIEWSNNSGWGLYGAGTANNFLGGSTYIGTTTTSTAKLTVSGSSTATSALAQGVNLIPTLVAAANNDVLVGLDINPTFTNGAFTGVSNIGLRVLGNIAETYPAILIRNTSALSGATTVFRAQDNSTGVCEFGTGSTGGVFSNIAYFYTNKSILDFYANAGNRMRIYGSTGNVVLQNGGTFTDNGSRLQVTGTVRITGDFYTTGTNAGIRFYDGASGMYYAGGGIFWENYADWYRFGYQYTNQTSGTRNIIQTIMTFAPTSGTASYSIYYIAPTVNQTGGSNGIIRGLHVAPTLTAAADWRSIQWDNNTGWGLYGAGTANNFLGGKLLLNSNSDNGNYSLQVNGGGSIYGSGNLLLVKSTGQYFLMGEGTGNNQYGILNWDATNNMLQISTQPFEFGTSGGQINLPLSGNVLLGTTTDAGFKLDVNGTARVSGNTTISLNQNAATKLTISNTTSGTSSEASTTFTSSNGNCIIGKMSATSNAYGIRLANDSFIYNVTSGDITLLNDFATGKIKFASGASSTAQMTLTAAGRLLLGTTDESTYILDVNGTTRIRENLLVELNRTTATSVTISNTTSATTSEVFYRATSSNGFFSFGKMSNAATVYKIRNNNDSYLYNGTAGDIAILNDFATGTIKFAAGGSSTAQATLSSNGNFGIGTASPVGKLTSADSVNNGTANVLYLSNTSQTGVTSAAINFINIDGTIKSSIIGAVFGNDYMTFNVGSNTERMRISAAGNLLLGTATDTGYRCQITSPSADTHLNVWGATAPSIRLDNAASGATQRFVIGLATATNNFIQGANAGDVCMTPGTSSALVFGMWQTSSSSEVMRISTSSNVLIGKNTDSGQKLQVVGKVNLTSLPTSATGLVAGDIWNNGGVLNIV